MKQATELPVKRIEDFDSAESDAKLVRRPEFWLGFIGFACLASAIALVASMMQGWVPAWIQGWDPAWFFAGAFAAVILGGTRLIDLCAEANAEREKVFDQYLATINYDLLRVVAVSPEYDQETKDAVIKYLSAAHPGWSLT